MKRAMDQQSLEEIHRQQLPKEEVVEQTWRAWT
jgi:hypothetical protein